MRDASVDDGLSGVQSLRKREGMRHAIRPLQHSVADDMPDAPPPERVFTLKRSTPNPQPNPEPIEAPLVSDTVTPESEPETLAAAEPIVATDLPVAHAAPLIEPDLPRWQQLGRIKPGSRLGKGPSLPVVDAARDSTSVRAFDLLRTRLRQTTQEHGWTNIAVVSPTSGSGSTFTAVNLALSLSRVDASRTVLMDFNLRNPGVADALDTRPRGAMSAFLSGQTSIKDHILRISDTLALGLNNTVNDNAAETLQATQTGHTLERMRAALQPELVIYDMPAMLAHDDVMAFLPHLDGVLLVSDGTKTMARDLMECESRLEGHVPLLGVVLNRARSNSIKRYG